MDVDLDMSTLLKQFTRHPMSSNVGESRYRILKQLIQSVRLLNKICDSTQNEEECSTEYETQCSTEYQTESAEECTTVNDVKYETQYENECTTFY